MSQKEPLSWKILSAICSYTFVLKENAAMFYVRTSGRQKKGVRRWCSYLASIDLELENNE
jgi:hypothetical protein